MSDKTDSFNDEYDKLGSDSGYSSTYYFYDFPFRAEESVAGVLGLTTGPLVSNIFALFLYMLKSMLMLFLRLIFFHHQELIPLLVFLYLIFSHQQ